MKDSEGKFKLFGFTCKLQDTFNSDRNIAIVNPAVAIGDVIPRDNRFNSMPFNPTFGPNIYGVERAGVILLDSDEGDMIDIINAGYIVNINAPLTPYKLNDGSIGFMFEKTLDGVKIIFKNMSTLAMARGHMYTPRTNAYGIDSAADSFQYFNVRNAQSEMVGWNTTSYVGEYNIDKKEFVVSDNVAGEDIIWLSERFSKLNGHELYSYMDLPTFKPLNDLDKGIVYHAAVERRSISDGRDDNGTMSTNIKLKRTIVTKGTGIQFLVK